MIEIMTVTSRKSVFVRVGRAIVRFLNNQGYLPGAIDGTCGKQIAIHTNAGSSASPTSLSSTRTRTIAPGIETARNSMNKKSFNDTKLYRSFARIMPVNPISIQVKSCTVLVFKS